MKIFYVYLKKLKIEMDFFNYLQRKIILFSDYRKPLYYFCHLAIAPKIKFLFFFICFISTPNLKNRYLVFIILKINRV